MLKGTRKPKFLEEIPAEDPNTKTLNYIKTNGSHIIQGDSHGYESALPNGYRNGRVVSERSLRSTTQNASLDVKPPAEIGQLQAQGTRKRKSRRSEMGGQLGTSSYEVKTRLRTRKSQAGL